MVTLRPRSSRAGRRVAGATGVLGRRLIAGAPFIEALTTSMNTTNQRARRELGWAQRYPTFRDGLPATIEAWRGSGRLVTSSVVRETVPRDIA